VGSWLRGMFWKREGKGREKHAAQCWLKVTELRPTCQVLRKAMELEEGGREGEGGGEEGGKE
jgi:hypothetical protein